MSAGVCYMTSQMGNGMLVTDRAQSLIDAAYHCLDYHTNAPGIRVK